MMTEQKIRNVSDTALWVAYYRAMESERPDARFKDPFARRLAGERGEAIVRSLPKGMSMDWVIVVRTCVFDELVRKAIELGADAVINLAAGLDTRPYRLDLPSRLRWVEIDLPDMLAYKEKILEGQTPRCRLERIALDLKDEAREKVFARLAAESKKALVITEGLLVYLTEADVASLAKSLRAQPSLRWWLLDHASPKLLKMLHKRMSGHLRQAPFQWGPENGAEFFRPFGWELLEERIPADEARRLGREMPLAWLFRLLMIITPAKKREQYRRMSGYALLGTA
jgi:methyltransferase (TIGR00027 family)